MPSFAPASSRSRYASPKSRPRPRSRPLALARGPRVPTSRRHAFFFARAIPRHPAPSADRPVAPRSDRNPPQLVRAPLSLMCAQASVSARAPALEAAGKPSAARAQDRDGPADGDGVAASAVSVAALLSELSEARARTPRGRGGGAPRSAGSRAEASELPPAHRRGGGGGGGPRGGGGRSLRAGGRARRREEGAATKPTRRGAAASALEADLRAAKAELADARPRRVDRADTAATNLAARRRGPGEAEGAARVEGGESGEAAARPARCRARARSRVAAGEHAERV